MSKGYDNYRRGTTGIKGVQQISKGYNRYQRGKTGIVGVREV